MAAPTRRAADHLLATSDRIARSFTALPPISSAPSSFGMWQHSGSSARLNAWMVFAAGREKIAETPKPEARTVRASVRT
jgi:hypothetical protein